MPKMRSVPQTARGRRILKHIEAAGLTLTQAAEKSGVQFATLHKLLHVDTSIDRVHLSVVERLVTRLGIPLDVFSPELAKAVRRAP